MSETLPVIFRVSRGEVTAVFPTLAWTASEMTCYAHIGQHGACSFAWHASTRAAKPEEYSDLLREVSAIYAPEYELRVYQKITPQHREAFRADWARTAKAYKEAK